MQKVSDSLLAKLSSGNSVPKQYSMVCEFYKSSAEPSVDGFDPASSDLLLAVAKTTNVSFRGVEYKRLIAKGGIKSITRTVKKEIGTFSITLSNSSREIVDFEQDPELGFEGLICVVRYIQRTLTTNLSDSIVWFTGQAQKPDTFDKSSESVSITIKQILKATEITIPRRTFTTEDADGRPQSDPEFEGFPFTPRGGTVSYETKERKGGLLGLFGAKKTVRVSQPYSSHNNLNRETAVPLVLGRTQMNALIFASEDLGTKINLMAFVADGHEKGVTSITNIRSITDGFPLMAIAAKMGRVGVLGGVEDGTNQANDDPGWIAGGIYSRTALIRADAGGTTLQNDDNAPDIACLVFGLIVPMPDGSGAFIAYDWTDNPVILTRWLLNSEYYFDKSSNWFDDAEIVKESGYCDHVLVDQVNTDTVLLPASQIGVAGTGYIVNKPTSSLNPGYFEKQSGLLDAYEISPFNQEVDYQYYTDYPINGDDWGTGVPTLPPTTLRRRYTINLLLKEQTKAFDFLFDTMLPTFNGYIVQKANGKFSIRVSKPEDFSFIYSSSAVGATEIHVKNVNYWKDNFGLLLIGANLPNSEVRRVIGYRYDTSVSISITASGGVSSSGGALTGGSSTVAPHATLTVTSESGAKTITINGLAVTYVPQAGESTITAAAFIESTINSNNELNKYIKAIWTPNTSTVLIESRIGYLELDSALEEIHLRSIADPTDAPFLTETSGGNLSAGKYQVCYSYVTIEGQTLTGPVSEITIGANKKLATPTLTLPARVISVNWFVSSEVNGVRRYLHSTRNTGASFFINSLPTKDDRVEPVINETGEELHRIALSITDKGDLFNNRKSSNMIKGSFKFPLGSRTPSTNQVKIVFPDASADYDLTPLIINDKAHQKKIKETNTKEINGLGIDSYHQARRIGNQLLAIWRDGDKFISVDSDGEALLLEEKDVICVTDESGRYRNEPVNAEDLVISDNDGHASISFTGRKYRRYYYDDQIPERLVPLPIIQNDTINKEHIAPVIEKYGDITLEDAYIKVSGYSEQAKFRKILASNFSDMSNIIDELVINGEVLPNQQLSAFERVLRIGAYNPIYYQIFHSSNGVQYGAGSNILSLTYENESEYGVPILREHPYGTPIVTLAAPLWFFTFFKPKTNAYSARNIQYRMYNDTLLKLLDADADSTQDFLVLNNVTGLPSSGKAQVVSETISWNGISGNTLQNVVRGLEGSTADSHVVGNGAWWIEFGEPLGDRLDYQFPQQTGNYYLQYRWQNSYRGTLAEPSDGWSLWSDVTYCYGTGSVIQPPAPIAPPYVEPDLPVGTEDAYDPIFDKENRFRLEV